MLLDKIPEYKKSKRTSIHKRVKSLNPLNTNIKANKGSPSSSKAVSPLQNERADCKTNAIDKMSNYEFEDNEYLKIQEKENKDVMSYIKALSMEANTNEIKQSEEIVNLSFFNHSSNIGR